MFPILSKHKKRQLLKLSKIVTDGIGFQPIHRADPPPMAGVGTGGIAPPQMGSPIFRLSVFRGRVPNTEGVAVWSAPHYVPCRATVNGVVILREGFTHPLTSSGSDPATSEGQDSNLRSYGLFSMTHHSHP